MSQVNRQQFTRDFRPVAVDELDRRTRAEGANLTPAQRTALRAADLDRDGRVGNTRAEVDAAWTAVRGMDRGAQADRVTQGQGDGYLAARALTAGHADVADDRRVAALPAATRDRIRQLEVDGNRDADQNLSRLTTSPGFARLPQAQQAQMLDAHARHANNAAVSQELTGLAGNAHFRGLDPATQRQAIDGIARHGGDTQIARVAGSRGFDQLSRASQDQALRAVDAHPRDAAVGEQVTRLAGDSHFRGLPQDTQTQALDQVRRHGADNQATAVATAPGFGQLSRARQQQMLDITDSHPADRALGRELNSLSNSGTFRRLPDGTQRRAIELTGQHGAGSAIPGLATSRGFGQASEATQGQMLEGQHARPNDRALAREYGQLGADESFRRLPADTQTQAVRTMSTQGGGTTIPSLVTANGFPDVSRARQDQMIQTVAAHPHDAQVARTLGDLSGNARFRALPDATQQQLVTMTGNGHAPRGVVDFATSPNFAQLTPAHQREMLTQLDGHPGDARVLRDYQALSGNANFRALPDASQARLIADTAARSPLDQVRGLDEAAILARGNTADGANELRVLGQTMGNSGLSPAERAQVRRIDAATFTPAAGLRLHGDPADQATYTQMTRREMLRSTSFHDLMQRQNADATHPLDVTLVRNRANIYMDGFYGNGQHTFDLSDLERLPDRPPVGSPDAMTQGENLVHGVAEARRGAYIGNNYGPAHRTGIVAENAYRRDIGQQSQMRMPPNDSGTSAAGNPEFRFNNGYREETTGGNNPTGVVRHAPPP